MLTEAVSVRPEHKDDLLIIATEEGTNAYLLVFSPVGDLSNWAVHNIRTIPVEEWVYYDPVDFALMLANVEYGTIFDSTNHAVHEDLLNWQEPITIDGTTIHWALRDGSEYRQLKRSKP